MSLLPGPGLTAALGGLNSNAVALSPGQHWTLGPSSGLYALSLSKYHNFQQRDPITGIWRNVGSGPGRALNLVYSDGVNYRLTNTTGCAVGALLTNGGSGYTSPPAVAASAGKSIWSAILGGAVSTSVTLLNGGINYTYAPSVWISPPPPGGIQATGYCAISGGAVTGVTLIDQGAGYIQAPTITFINDPRELDNPTLTTGYGASAALSLTGGGTVTGLLCLDPGLGALSTLPTLSFSGGGGSGAAATAIMNWTITGCMVVDVGAGLSGSYAEITGVDLFPTTSPAYANPTTQSNLVVLRPAVIRIGVSSGAIVNSTITILDGGAYSSAPALLIIPSASVVIEAPTLAFSMGGAQGVSYVTPIGA